MKPIVFLFLLLGNFTPGNAKDSTAQYYQYVNSAEGKITANEWVAAIDLYEAMPAEQLKMPDLYNYAMLCFHTGQQSEKLADLYIEMYRKGFPDSLLNNKAFAPAFNSEAVIQAKKTMQAERNRLLEKSIGNTKKLYTLYQKDQAIFTYRVEHNMMKLNDSLATLNNENIYTFLQFVADKGFPSEDNIGFVAYDNPFYSVIPLHCFQTCDSSLRQKMKTVVDQALSDNKIRPHQMILYRESGTVYTDGSTGNSLFAILDCNLYEIEDTDPLILQQIDHFRNTIYLCSLNEFRQKILYKYQNPGQPFYLPVDLMYLSSDKMTLKDKNHFSEGRKLLFKGVPDCTIN